MAKTIPFSYAHNRGYEWFRHSVPLFAFENLFLGISKVCITCLCEFLGFLSHAINRVFLWGAEILLTLFFFLKQAERLYSCEACVIMAY